MMRKSHTPLSGSCAGNPLFDRKVSVTDGPFAETKELVGGWATVAPLARRDESEGNGSEAGFRCVDPVLCGE